MKTATLVLVGALALGSWACQDMDVTNPNNPNRESVLKSSPDLQSLVSTTFRTWFNQTEGGYPSVALSYVADEFSPCFFDWGGLDLVREPRQPVNQVAGGGVNLTASPWQGWYRIISGINTALRAVDGSGVVIREAGVDVTARFRTFAKFMQGLSHGQAALVYDKGYVSSETLDFDVLTFDQAKGQLRPYKEVMDTAMVELKEAIKLAQSKNFTLPGGGTEWIPGYNMSSQELARLAHTYIARYMAYVARSPVERAAVNWAEVISHLDQGIKSDFAPQGIPGIMESIFKHRMARQRTVTPSDHARPNNKLVGPADLSDGFIRWLATEPHENRAPFRMNIGDRRIDMYGKEPPPETCADAVQYKASCGLYFGFHQANVCAADRGLARRSWYFYHRWGRGTRWQLGPIPIINMAELDLLRAEALIRLGRASDAIPLINKTRVGNGRLPAITSLEGVPGTAPNCVPRKRDGSCGSLWDALRYEKRIETAGLEGGIQFYDARAWATLVDNSPIHLPMPLIDLELLGMPVYTFGGGQAGSAKTEADTELCPLGVSLPRCPAK